MNNLYRSRTNKRVTGLCGGLGEAYHFDPTLLRLVLVVTAVFSGGTVVLIYLLASLVIPKEPFIHDPTNRFGSHHHQGGSYQADFHETYTSGSGGKHQAAYEPKKKENDLDDM
ncbi:MAG: hypothetical protein A2189_07005, partial [Paenibacillus sp. RIFOXYA1_FULL_44_5]